MKNPEHDACGVGFLADRLGRARPDIVPLALKALARMDHRGGIGADGETGDGAGILTAIPWTILTSEKGAVATADMADVRCGVGSVFLPRASDDSSSFERRIENALDDVGLPLLTWREVPTNDRILGPQARASKPRLRQFIVSRPEQLDDDAYENALFVARREIEAAFRFEDGASPLYVASLSHRTIVYKALVRGSQLRAFYDDLREPSFETAFAVFHNRFCTNTHASWSRVQPFRQLGHNGEINTIDGNRRAMEARGLAGAAASLGLSAAAGLPLLDPSDSDSASLDEAMRLLISSGRSALEAISMLMPPAWEGDDRLMPRVRAAYAAAASAMEPWDGPALVAFSDGRFVGAQLDRNGLRPARTLRTRDELILVASEAGVLDVGEERVADRGRLGPGGFLGVDLRAGKIIDQKARDAVFAQAFTPQPLQTVRNLRGSARPSSIGGDSLRQLAAAGCTREELQFVTAPMVRDIAEPVGSMGDDTPLACLSKLPQSLFAFFKQRFAQVTNPPIDPLRERLVMSLRTVVGAASDPFAWSARSRADSNAVFQVPGPILSEDALASLEAQAEDEVAGISLLFPTQPGALETALDRVILAAEREVRSGASCLVLRTRCVDGGHAAIPSLLATSAIHQHLIRTGLRLRASLIVETADARSDHDIAALIAFGAAAVCPFGAFDAARHWASRTDTAPSAAEAVGNVITVLEKGLLKILSKMGISTLRSYQGSQLFEAIGLDRELVDRHFTGTPCHLAGHGLIEIERDVLARHARAFAESFTDLEEGGTHRYRRDGEAHAFEPRVIKSLHAMARSSDPTPARAYEDLIAEREPIAVRDLFRVRAESGAQVPLDQVEPAKEILRRFSTAAMSLGSLSPEAHEALAIALNRTPAKSNSGEGGEPEENYWRDIPNGDHANHRIKQVASARFGVTADYLVSAEELQIKIAQGSKPGEGGQLPGRKVVAHIARVRHSSEGVTLISPPPHHDIYSIEDLAQLIHDLRSVNPGAAVSVKLVSSAGIGAIASGVAKAGADTIVIGGHDGGTGASPLSSIRNAGTPWELGLVDVHRTLTEQGLRGKVRLRVEGGLKTGRDVVIGAALGADEFAFGSAALVAAGCVMARQCHLNTCPAGIATQREDLRRQFKKAPEHAIRFFDAIADEVRRTLAALGRTTLEGIVGDSTVLDGRPVTEGSRGTRVSAVGLLAPTNRARSREEHDRNPLNLRAFGIDDAAIAKLRTLHGHISPLSLSKPISVADRSVGAKLAGQIARYQRGRRLSEDTIRLDFRGSAGQSFGAFAVTGMTLSLEGEANDYAGKGLSGGEISIRPKAGSARPGRAQVIAGNTLLYGATAGRFFAAGSVGERFAVRMSGAVAVVEGAGDHACEYMTAGTAVILGPVGRNLGAGMSGGVVFVHDPEATLDDCLNPEMVRVSGSLSPTDEVWLKEAVQRHWESTGSALARRLLEDWRVTLRAMRRVTPIGLPAAEPVPWPIDLGGQVPPPQPLVKVA